MPNVREQEMTPDRNQGETGIGTPSPRTTRGYAPPKMPGDELGRPAKSEI